MQLAERLVGRVTAEEATVEARATVAVVVALEVALMVAGLHRQHLHPLHASRWAQHPNH